MPVNNMTVSQASQVLNEIVQQATGQQQIRPITNPQDFVSVAQTALLNNTDQVMNAISQMWGRTIFSVRDYNAPLSSLEMDIDRWGNATRKLSPVAKGVKNDEGFEWPVFFDAAKGSNPTGEGEAVDHYKIAKQEVLQTNFYGTAVYMQPYTIFMTQFDTAFRGPEEFARFNSMLMSERYNDRESFKEGIARGLQANYIASIIKEGQNSRVVHLLRDYNTETGLELTAQTVKKPENFAPFIRWAYAKINFTANLMSQRSQMFQTVINNKPVLRHTPAQDMRLAVFSEYMEQIRTMVLSDTYHDNLLRLMKLDEVAFWQNIETPDSVAVNPVYTGTNGQVITSDSEIEQAGIFAVLHDRDALGYRSVYDRVRVTPVNAAAEYYNEYYHSTFKTVSDMTEKGVVFLMD